MKDMPRFVIEFFSAADQYLIHKSKEAYSKMME